MSHITIWHNPRCSKSRNAVALLEEKGLKFKTLKYLDEQLKPKDIKDVLSKLDISAKDLLRKKETIYKDLELDSVNSENALIKAMIENPKLIERPIVVKGEKAAIGRPIENISELLGL